MLGMNYKYLISTFIFLLIISSSIQANQEIYGRLDIAISNINKGKQSSKSEIKSHASRIGFKGSEIFDNGLSVIFQYELQNDPIDWDPAFKQRNSFLGLKGAFGKFIVGMHDTPVKQSQAKIDLFNDTSGDIKNILWGENRSQKIVQWTTPSLRGFKVNLMTILEDSNEGFSFSINWSGKFIINDTNFSLAFDQDVPQKGYYFNTTRITASIPISNPVLIGFIWQESKDSTGRYDDDGYIVSLKLDFIKELPLKFMYGESDMIRSGGELLGIGFDYKIAKPVKLYVNYVEKNYDNIEKSTEEIMFGMQYKFNFGLF